MLTGVVSEAILKSLDQSKRDVMIADAIKHLLTPQSRSFGSGPSPLQEAFQQGLSRVAEQLAFEQLQTEEVKEKIRGLITEAFVQLTETKREETVKNLAAAIEKGLTYKEY